MAGRFDSIRTERLLMRRWRDAALCQAWSVTAVINRPSQAVMLRPGMAPHGPFGPPALMAGHPPRRHIACRRQRSGGAGCGTAAGQRPYWYSER